MRNDLRHCHYQYGNETQGLFNIPINFLNLVRLLLKSPHPQAGGGMAPVFADDDNF
jgi:hypothetical protein